MDARPALRRTEFGSYADGLADADGDELPPPPPLHSLAVRRGSDDSDLTMAPADDEQNATRALSKYKLESRENLILHSRMTTSNASAAAPESAHLLHASQSERRFVPPLMLLGPVLGVLFLTAGMATGMAIWIKIHMLPLSSDGVIYVREGAETEGDRTYRDPVLGDTATLRFEEQIAHATTLSISSAISTLVGNSVFPLMGLVTYSLASSWLQLQTDIARRRSLALSEQLPTPLQYALLTQICGANSFEAVYNTLRHMVRSRAHRTTIPSILKQAFAWLSALLLLTTSIAGLDVYLHESMRTVQVLDINSTVSMHNFSWALNTSLCEPTTLSLQQSPCLVGAPLLASGVPTWAALYGFPIDYVGPEGWLVANNASKDHGVFSTSSVSLPGNPAPQSLSFVVSPQVRAEDIFESSSIGMSSQCRMITQDCHPTANSFNCADAGEPQISIGATTTTYPSGVQGSNLGSNLYISDSHGTAMLGAASQMGAQTNPLPVSALLTYSSQLDVGPETEGFENFIVNSGGGGPASTTWMYGALACSVTLYDLEMSYFNASYSFDQIRPADAGLLHALSGPVISGAITDAVASSLARVAGRVSADEFADLFGVALSYNTLAFMAGMLQPQPVKVNSWKPILASQYSLPALLAYLALLYAYAICAVVLFFWAWGMSSDCVEYNDPLTGTRMSVPAVVLAQRQLMDPGHIIALHLGNGSAPTSTSSKPTNSGPPSAIMTPSSSRTGLVYGCDLEKTGSASSHSDPPRAPPSSSYSSSSGGGSGSSASTTAAVRTISTDLLGLFDESALAERVVVGLEAHGKGFGVWPVQRAPGAVGQDERNRDSLLRTQNLFWHHHSR
ncbi:hypothetical protein OC834_007420 [Tilletia horrida]|nr:hypothetical protein OC834_007420 [Tilletia horrida]